MRITNSMVTNNILLSLNRNKLALSKYESQFSTGKKIQKPSDDPIVAVRALKFRARLEEIEQYKANIDDGISWMEVTEQSVSNVIEIAKKIQSLCVTGVNDTLGKDERDTLISSIKQLQDQMANEGNTDYAGRHVFSGFKTDTPLTFTKDLTKTYAITESFSADDIETVQKVFDGTPPTLEDISRIRVGYSDVDGTFVLPPEFVPVGLAITSMDATDAGAYKPAAGTIHFLKDTGELIINDTDVSDIPTTNFNFTYEKSSFEKNDRNPILYYNCQVDGETYEKPSDSMEYQVSYNQSVQINTMGNELISSDLMRDIEEIIRAIGEIACDDTPGDELKQDLLGDKFDKLNGLMKFHLDDLIREESDLGTRMNRLELTETRLGYDKDNFMDLMSKNEDVDVAEVAIQMKSQEMIYNASLMASSKIVQTTLLDFVR